MRHGFQTRGKDPSWPAWRHVTAFACWD